jgi:putative ABC transport system permease protein
VTETTLLAADAHAASTGPLAVPSGSAAVLAVLVVVVAAALAASAVLRLAGLEHAPAVPRAATRAVVQLGAVSLVVAAVLRSVPLSLAFVVVMLGTASLTAARRITPHRSGLWAGAAVASGALPVLGVLAASGLLPPVGAALVPVGGILVGGAMTATSLAGRACLDALRDRAGEYEAALALGLPSRDAALLVCSVPAGRALVPALDQTRTVGMVTLPGAFVGMLLAGAGALQAGTVQLVVLVALLLAESVAIAVTLELVARGRVAAGIGDRGHRVGGSRGHDMWRRPRALRRQGV